MNPTPATPWYKRSIKPAWLPEWLGVCLLIALAAAATAIAFAIFIDDDNPRWMPALFGGSLGFALGVVVVSANSVRRKPGLNDSKRLSPPDIVRWPVLAAVTVMLPLDWVLQRRVYVPIARRKNDLYHGDAAEAIGIAIIGVIALALTVAAVHDWKTTKTLKPSRCLAVFVAVGALIFAVVRAA